jgi:peptide chain release factor 1
MFDQLDNLILKYEDIMHELAAPGTTDNQERFRSLMKEQSDLTPIVDTYQAYRKNRQEIADDEEMLSSESDEEMRAMFKEELASAKDRDAELTDKLRYCFYPRIRMMTRMSSWR